MPDAQGLRRLFEPFRIKNVGMRTRIVAPVSVPGPWEGTPGRDFPGIPEEPGFFLFEVRPPGREADGPEDFAPGPESPAAFARRRGCPAFVQVAGSGTEEILERIQRLAPGFDGVEIGGVLEPPAGPGEDRIRLAEEALQRIRDRAGYDMVVGIRVNAAGSGRFRKSEWVRRLEVAGADYIQLSGRGAAAAAPRIRDAVSIPVALRHPLAPAEAEAVLAAGAADLVCVLSRTGAPNL